MNNILADNWMPSHLFFFDCTPIPKCDNQAESLKQLEVHAAIQSSETWQPSKYRPSGKSVIEPVVNFQMGQRHTVVFCGVKTVRMNYPDNSLKLSDGCLVLIELKWYHLWLCRVHQFHLLVPSLTSQVELDSTCPAFWWTRSYDNSSSSGNSFNGTHFEHYAALSLKCSFLLDSLIAKAHYSNMDGQ